MAKGRGYMGAEAPPDYVFSGSREYDDLFRRLQEDIYRTRWTPDSVIQSPTAFTGGGFAGPFGICVDGGLTAAALNDVDQYSVPMEGPMRFAGRGIPRWNDYPGVDAPELIPIAPSVPMDPPRFPTLPGRAPISIWETSPDGGPRRGSRRPPYSRDLVPEVVYPPEDTRSEWEKWKDSFKDDWKAR